jgi:predicted nucleic acid-binding protein
MLLDTDVMIDFLRGFPAAVSWLGTLGTTPIGLPGLVAMELIQGCQSLAEQRHVENELLRFQLHWPTSADCARALTDFSGYHLSHNLGLLDALIGETAVGLAITLATFNIKHYSVIPGLQTIQPY